MPQLITTRPRIAVGVIGAFVTGVCVFGLLVGYLNPTPWLAVPLINLGLATAFGIIKEVR